MVDERSVAAPKPFKGCCGSVCAQPCGYPGHTISRGRRLGRLYGPQRKNYGTVTAENAL